MTDSRARFLVALVLALASTPRLSAQSALRLGVEFQVNSYTSSDQNYAAIDVSASGDFVVTWASLGQDGGSSGIFARRFNATGIPQALELQVNTYTGGDQHRPAIALAPGGAFVVAWDDIRGHIFARRFNASGVPQGGELQVSTYTGGLMFGPAVAAGAAGDFVVAWTNFTAHDGSGRGVFARRFDAAGTGLAAEFQVNTVTLAHQHYPSVALDDDGDFVVAWTSSSQDASGYGIFAKRFGSNGGAQAAEFQVNAVTNGAQLLPAVAMRGDGAFLVAWTGEDADSTGVFSRVFDSAGVPQSADAPVNTFIAGSQIAPAAAVTGDRFIVAWQSVNQGGATAPRVIPFNFGIFAREIGANGVPQSTEFQVNTYTSTSQQGAAIAADNGSRFVVAWNSEGGQDGNGRGVFAQRHLRIAVLDIDGNGSVTALSDGLLVLRYLFGFTGTTLTSGTIGEGCTRCDAAAIVPYLDGLV